MKSRRNNFTHYSGKGVSLFERDYKWHGKPPSKEEGENGACRIRRIVNSKLEIKSLKFLKYDPKLKLNPKIFNADVEQMSIQEGFGQGFSFWRGKDTKMSLLFART